jgi:hypothetical protein
MRPPPQPLATWISSWNGDRLDKFENREATGMSQNELRLQAKERGFALLSASDLHGLQNADSHPLCFSQS